MSSTLKDAADEMRKVFAPCMDGAGENKNM